MKKCLKCNAPMEDTQKWCPVCGAQYDGEKGSAKRKETNDYAARPVAVSPSRSKATKTLTLIAAGALAIFLLVVFIMTLTHKGCGENLTWSLKDGVLTISGTGAMDDWTGEDDVPWAKKRDEITALNIEDGVTTIGDYAFWGCVRIANVVLPDSISEIGDSAFAECEDLANLTVPASVTVIGENTFAGSPSFIAYCDMGSYADIYFTDRGFWVMPIE